MTATANQATVKTATARSAVASSATAGLVSVGRALRNVMGDPRAKLTAAISEIQTLCAELAVIEKEILSRVDVSRLQRAVDERRIAWEADKENVDKEIALRVAALIRDQEIDRTAGIRRSFIASPPHEQALGELFKKHRDWRKVLQKAVEAKLTIAKNEFAQTQKAVEKELAGEGFDRDQLDNEPRIKRARHEVELWEALRERILTDRDDLRTWRYAVNNLFNEDS